MKVNMHEAKSQLSKLGERAWQGEEIVIAKAGIPYLNLTPHKQREKTRMPGRLKGTITIADDFDDSSEEIIALFDGEQ